MKFVLNKWLIAYSVLVPIALRPMIYDNTDYMLACFFSGVAFGVAWWLVGVTK